MDPRGSRENADLTPDLRYTRRHGQTEQQAQAGGAGRPQVQHGVLGRRDTGVVQGLPQGLPQRPALRRGVQENLRKLLPVRRRVQVRGARVQNF